MKRIVKSNEIPHKSIIRNEFEEIGYCDSYRIIKKTDETVDEIITQIFKAPQWVIRLMKIRNRVVKIFGLKGEKTDKLEEAAYYPVGSKAVYFTVTDRNANEIIVGEDDKHLCFRASVLIDNSEQSFIYLTTVVRFKNMWGKIYFFPVKPFHGLIMKSLMKRQL